MNKVYIIVNDYEVYIHLLLVLKSLVTPETIIHMHTFYSNKSMTEQEYILSSLRVQMIGLGVTG